MGSRGLAPDAPGLGAGGAVVTALDTATAPQPVTPTPPQRRDPGPDAHLDGGVRLGAGLLLWLGLLLVTYWWDRDGGLADLTGWRSGLTSVGRLTGLWAADLLLVQVLLMSRLPPLEQAFGRERLTRIHRVVGFLSVDLMAVHVVTILLGYAGGRLAPLPATTWELITTSGGILLSVAGTACLVMVAVTSVKMARRRLRYESWHLLHLYAYLGVGLALPHQLWTGQQFLASRAATIYWWTLWAAAAGAILLWRIGLPSLRSLRHGLRVTSVVRESSDVVSVYLTGRALDRLPLRAGQFLTVRFLHGPGWTRANPFSLSAAPDGRSLRITAKALGEGSARLAHLRPGTRVLVEGPYGRLTSRARTRRRVMLAGRESVSRRCAPWPRDWSTAPARWCCCSATPTSRCSAVNSTPWLATGACATSRCPVAARARHRSSGPPRVTRRTRWPPCGGGSRTSPTATCSCAARPAGPPAWSGSPSPPECPTNTSAPRVSDGDLMTRIAIWLASTVTIVVLLFGYHTSANSTSTAAGVSSLASAPTASTVPTVPTASGGPSPSPTATASPPPGPTSGGSTPSKTYAGAVAQTRWGPVQVQITVAGRKITDVQVPQYPQGNSRDAEINSYALPTLIQETEQQQSAAIDMVSGATVTSDGYLRSLQSALDSAGL